MIFPLGKLNHELLLGIGYPGSNIHKVVVNYFLDEDSSNLRPRQQHFLPGCSSDEVTTGLFTENLIDETTALVECNAISSYYRGVRLLYDKMLYFLKLNTNFHGSLLNKCNLTKFLRLIRKYIEQLVAYWLQIIKDGLHEHSIRLVQPSEMLPELYHVENVGLLESGSCYWFLQLEKVHIVV